MKPGIHQLSYPEYEAVDAVNNSLLAQMHRSPAHAREYKLHPPNSSSAFVVGEATHAAVLEPDRFKAEYITVPAFDGHKNSNKYKEARALWDAENTEKVHLTAQEYDLCTSLCAAAWAHPELREMLSYKNAKRECTAIWKDTGTGLLCKARIDLFTEWHKYPIVLDLKSAMSASPFSFGQAIAKYGYLRQAAFYLRGLNALAESNRRWVWAALEKEQPWCVALYEPRRDEIAAGEERVQALLYKYAECMDKNEWPGYPTGLLPARIPEWATRGSSDAE